MIDVKKLKVSKVIHCPLTNKSPPQSTPHPDLHSLIQVDNQHVIRYPPLQVHLEKQQGASALSRRTEGCQEREQRTSITSTNSEPLQSGISMMLSPLLPGHYQNPLPNPDRCTSECSPIRKGVGASMKSTRSVGMAGMYTWSSFSG